MLSISHRKTTWIFSRSMSTPRVLTFFCSSFSFNDLWLFMVYISFALNPANQKKIIVLEWHWFQCYATFHRKSASSWFWYAPRWIVTKHFGVHRNTIQSLMRRFRESDNARNSQRAGRPCMTSGQQHNHIRLVHLRDRFQTSSLTANSIHGLRSISSRTIRNRFRDRHIRPRRSAIHSMLLSRHCAARLTWCKLHLRFRRRIGPISSWQMNPVST